MPPIDTIHTYAKINLILQVAPPITDPSHQSCGMHPIYSWMHAINLADEINIEQNQDGQSEFDIHWKSNSKSGRRPVEWDTESDLIFRAHALLQSETNRSLPVKITASKSIPAGGGLGGGSSNAAGTLMGLNDLFELGFDEPALQTIAFKLGSDIPFFVDINSHRVGIPPKPAVVSGFGNQIQRTPRLNDSISILVPKFGCPTGEVYKAFDTINSTQVLDPDQVLKAATSKKIDSAQLINHLTEPAMMIQPELKTIFAKLNNVPINAQLSGSGSTIFVLGDQCNSKLRQWLKTVHPSDLTIHAASLN